MGGHSNQGCSFPEKLPPIIPASVLKDFYITGENDDYFVYGEGGDAQVFTPLTSYTLTSVKLKFRADNIAPNPGVIKIGIQSTGLDGGPSGTYLTSTLFDTSDFPVFPAAAEWREIVFSMPVNVTAGIKYALIIDMFTNPPSTSILFRVHINTGAYPGGEIWGGSPGYPWTKLNFGLDDAMFEIWGY